MDGWNNGSLELRRLKELTIEDWKLKAKGKRRRAQGRRANI